MSNNFCVKNIVACSFSSVRRKSNLLVILTKVFPRKKTIGAFPHGCQSSCCSHEEYSAHPSKNLLQSSIKGSLSTFCEREAAEKSGRNHLRLSAKSQGQKPFEVSGQTIPETRAIRQVPIQSVDYLCRDNLT